MAGWVAVVLALLALAPSFVPGAMSMIGFALSLLALIISLFSLKTAGQRYFRATLVIVVGGVLLVNDGLRVWYPLELPLELKAAMYGLLLLAVIGGVWLAKGLGDK